ncbi:MBL fold metallo-hydrolase [Vallitalea longa]|uniref:MBL fold metallo-hydrolase n=1 Tax=Vallitalea longa TaxID=2936439 RepID=A0A9W5YAP5_9FIRM|nr:MBL fold metallo-hydrolase [Vallitalea longa]GKX29639.1 MBL fold metallo-hydrolase [Vallitalea longa]
MNDWFTIEKIDKDTHIISEYRHWEESHAYLLNGTTYSLLIDTGLGIKNIYEEVIKLTDKPIIAVATHVHWDHIGGHEYFHDFYVHEDEVNWLAGEFPLTMEQVKGFVVEDCDLPEDFNIDDYKFFQGTATRVLKDNDVIDIGGRSIEVLHTPGHSPGHMCFYEKDRKYLFTGDLVYIGTLFAYFPSTDPKAYLSSIDRVAALPVNRVFPAHHNLDIKPSILQDMKKAFNELNDKDKLHHGSGTFEYNDFAIWL